MSPSGATDLIWSQAFAAQSLSDLDMQFLLARSNAPKCHRLHFLQMAAEKLCKAFLIRANGYEALKLTHTVVEKYLPLVLQRPLARERSSSQAIKSRLKAVKFLGREIELLSPACGERGVRDDNSEYPWLANSNSVQIPCNYSFPNIDDESIGFVVLTKLMRTAAESYLV